jgi:bifunctional non-homologous end joining protein LigD
MRKPLLTFIPPQLAPHWLLEIKLDGYRTITTADDKTVRCYSRTDLDWTDRFGAVPGVIAKLGLKGALLDGEMVVVDAKGHTSFGALQEALTAGGAGISYFVFDLLAEGGNDLRSLPLGMRKARLQKLLAKAPKDGPVLYCDHIRSNGEAMLRNLCELGLEGVIAKRADKPYRSGRGEDWLKIKCVTEQGFMVIGYTLSDSPGRPFGSLLLGTRERDGKLRHVGRVGTGWDEREVVRIATLLLPLRTEDATVDRVLPGQVRREIRWIRPELIAKVGYSEITRDGALRHPRYLGLQQGDSLSVSPFVGGDAMTRRELIEPNSDKRYVRRDTKGQFKESDDLGRSLSTDRRKKAKTVVKAGQGDRGDQRRR